MDKLESALESPQHVQLFLFTLRIALQAFRIACLIVFIEIMITLQIQWT